MAKISSERLIKKYGKNNIQTGKYQKLMNEIISNNSETINRAILRISKQNYDKALKKITTKKQPFIMPKIEDVLPKRSVFMKKSAEHGKFIVDTLKDKLTTDLRQSIEKWTKKPYETYRRQFKLYKKPVVNPEIIDNFEKKIKDTFETYTKKDLKYGVPGNIHNIAVTEIRSNVDEIKYKYAEELLRRNDNLEAWKKWLHYKFLSKKFRPGHREANGQMVKFNEDFKINVYKEIKGQYVFMGVVSCSHPHDSRLPLDQIISCNCGYVIIIRRKD